MDWMPLQAIGKGVSLTDLVNRDFIEYLNERFDDKIIEAVNIQIRIRDEKISGYMENEIVSIANRNGQDTLLKNVIVDADNNETLNIFTDAISKIKEE